jgi:hypothetical protein
LKRKFGESLKARKYQLQVKEIKIKVILYNLSRAMKSFSVLVVIEEFYRALVFIIFKSQRDDECSYRQKCDNRRRASQKSL